MTINENASLILGTLITQPREKVDFPNLSGEDLSKLTNLKPDDINDAVSMLVQSGLVAWLQTLGSAPYKFATIGITPRGRYEYEKAIERDKVTKNNSLQTKFIPPTPIGSPFGFNDSDWEIVSERKSNVDCLYVVFGYKFESEYYNSEQLIKNIEHMFQKAIDEYNKIPGSSHVKLNFFTLRAGYGEHLFNEIARDIIGADIAIFETSDLNPNVMIEIGVALTWGVRVLPIKVKDCPKPPSDISGQTWVDYRDNGQTFDFLDHEQNTFRMVERAIRKKSRI